MSTGGELGVVVETHRRFDTLPACNLAISWKIGKSRRPRRSGVPGMRRLALAVVLRAVLHSKAKDRYAKKDAERVPLSERR